MSRSQGAVPQVSDALMQEIVARIVGVMKPLKIILFGSYARTDARSDSDIDLLIIAESSEPRYRRAAPLYGVLSDIAVPMDILVYSPQEVQEWSGVEQAFVTTSIREGKILYEDPGRPSERLAS